MLPKVFFYRRYLFGSFWTDLRYRYAGTALGFYWFFVNPLLEVFIYAVIFSQLVSIRSSGGRGISFTLYLVTGLFPWLAFSQMIQQGTKAIKSNAIYMRRVSIPAEVFILKDSLISLFTLGIYILLLIPVIYISGNSLSWHVVLTPFLAILLTVFGFSLSISLAYIRMLFPDLGEIIPAILQIWRWTLPIIYSDENFPALLKEIISWNPPYYFITSFRNLMIYHSIPTFRAWIVMFFWLSLAMIVSLIVSKKFRSEIKDLL